MVLKSTAGPSPSILEEITSGGVTAPLGFKAAAAAAGIRYPDRLDLALIYSEVAATAAGVYTCNRVQAAPVQVTQDNLTDGQARAVVVNAGIANAATGAQGLDDAREMTRITARVLDINPDEVAVASTGVIGLLLPIERIEKGIIAAANGLSRNGGTQAAQAILTTDTRPKEIAVRISLGEKSVTIGGMAKGSGMIHPCMATMLGFITTDAAITSEALRLALQRSTDRSFNLVTVDGDTSTNDMVVVLANGLAGNPLITIDSPELKEFQTALDYVNQYLAREIARDGEGASRLIEVRVKNAPSLLDAQKAARAVAGSSLVKTAVFGRDPNWGRILAAVGYSGAEFAPEQIAIWLGEVLVAQEGVETAFNEDEAREALDRETVLITVDLGVGTAEATAWGCDLTFDYIKINASYRS
ncbi:MAG: bifunctional glutamate N-acetyltransferase/amino-acid acetyltransferase ArgJ [Syntrophomonadaceae bacterium]|nr:bifunctional glutamate N-acetyltransferase/amino-acid acetyltransferase ArgJ [Syntrophomonadaceae bacterium]